MTKDGIHFRFPGVVPSPDGQSRYLVHDQHGNVTEYVPCRCAACITIEDPEMVRWVALPAIAPAPHEIQDVREEEEI